MAPPIQAPISHEEKIDRVQIAFTAICGSIALVAAAAFPFITYLMLSAAAASLLMAIRTEPEALDTTTKVVIGGVILLGAIYFAQIAAFSQIVLATLSASGIAAFYIHEHILASQITLNTNLRQAATQSDLAQVNQLLTQGADPCAPDNAGNTAFHCAAQNHPQAPAVLTALKTHLAQEKPTFKSVVQQGRRMFTAELGQQWHTWWQRAKAMLRQNVLANRAAFYEASSNLFNAHLPGLNQAINALSHYLRSELAYPKSHDTRNQANLRCEDMIDTIEAPVELKAAMKLGLGTPIPAAPIIIEPIPNFTIQADMASSSSSSTPAATNSTTVDPALKQRKQRKTN